MIDPDTPTDDLLRDEHWRAETCPTCQAQHVRDELVALLDDLDDDPAALVDRITTADRIRCAVYSLDYVLALVDAKTTQEGP